MSINILSTDHSSDIFISNSDRLYNSTSSGFSSLENFFFPVNHSVDSGILPPGLLYVSKNFLVFERPPCYQNISVIHSLVSGMNEEDTPVIYRIFIPWQIYIVHFNDDYFTNSVQVHFMDSPLSSLDQQLYMAPLLNLYTSGLLCRPMYENLEDIDRYPKNISGVIQSAYDWVWNSGSNLDITETVVQYFLQAFNTNNFSSFCSKAEASSYTLAYSRTPTAYYADRNTVQWFYQQWENNVNINNYTIFNWPKNSSKLQAHAEFRSIYNSRISEYRQENDIPFFSSSECCDDCICYDEESDEYYQSDECECSCHEPEQEVSDIDFFKWAGLNDPSGLTFIQAFNTFSSNNSYDSFSSSSHYFSLIEDQFRYCST